MSKAAYYAAKEAALEAGADFEASGWGINQSDMIQVGILIQLKRIADSLERAALKDTPHDL